MKLKFYGVRGSAPSANKNALKYGGNTPCIYVQTDNNFHLILDAGTGIIELGEKLINDNKPIYILLSHNHWDHIQGFPFFRPIYQENREITIIPGLTTPYEPNAILKQFSGSYFPISAQQLAANIVIKQYPNLNEVIYLGNLTIHRRILNHPNDGCAYLIKNSKNTFAYITDNELFPPSATKTSIKQWQQLLSTVDLLIHDAQYQQSDFPKKLGWGHSEITQVIALAIKAKVKNLCLFSHDHLRSDKEIEDIIQYKINELKKEGQELNIFPAQENNVFSFSNDSKSK